MQHLHYELNLTITNTVVVTLDKQANVLLMNSSNYNSFRRGSKYKYYGGQVTTSPYRISPPTAGSWHVVINLGGGSGTVRASVAVQ